MVYAREIDDTQLTLIVSGKLWRNSMIMQDEQTGSLWSHVTGVCLEGEYQGKTLEQVPSVQTTWAEWQAAHPDTPLYDTSHGHWSETGHDTAADMLVTFIEENELL